MAKLTWDAVGERLYETGVKNCVLYVYDGTAEDKTKVYPLGVAWNGITSISESPEGAEATALYADDIKYLNLIATEEFKATVEAYMYPDAFCQCNGEASLVTGAVIGQQNRKMFGLAYKTTVGNDTESNGYGYKLHIIYGCYAAPSERAYSTINDSPEAITFSWSLSTTPVDVTGFKPTATVVIDSTAFKTEAQKAALKALEDKLFGTADADAYLPLPAEIKTTLTVV